MIHDKIKLRIEFNAHTQARPGLFQCAFIDDEFRRRLTCDAYRNRRRDQ